MAEDENVDFIETGTEDWYTYDHLGYETTVTNVNESNELLHAVNVANEQYSQLNGYHEVKCEEPAAEEEEQAHHNVILNYDGQPEDVENDLSKHNLVLKEIITEQGLIKESYFCQECCTQYSDINDFLLQHPGIELLSEKPEDDDGDIEEDTQGEYVSVIDIKNEGETQDKLWDLVENVVEKDDDSNVNGGDVDEDPVMSDLIQLNNSNGQQMENETVTNVNEALETKGEHYFCYECHQLFSDLRSAEEHDCGKRVVNETTENPEAEELHQPEDEDELVCSYCQKVCLSYNDLIDHMTNCEQNILVPITTDGQELFSCDLCHNRYPNLRALYNHQRSHKNVKYGVPVKPVKCEICNTIFQAPKNLKLHMKMHAERSVKSIQEALPAGALPEYNELNQFFCEICNKSFDQRLLNIHKNMHQNVEEYNCSKCNKQFNNIRDYEMHTQMHFETKTKNTSNHNVTTAASSDANGSDPSQNSNKKHACQYCGKEFQRPYEKVKHERVHTGEKPYNCEVCGKSFRVSYSLTLHLRTHTDIRPYVCAICNKRFKQQSVYVHHLKTHEAERQYKCEECGKSFRTSVQLCGHINSHKKPFNCTECNRPFASMYAVRVHMKTHNKNNKANKNFSNRCNLCGASYARTFALRIHMKEQHGIEMDSSTDLETSPTALTKKYLNKPSASGTINTNENMDFIDEEEDDNNELSSHQDADLDETEAATQTIMPKDDIIVDNAEQIIMEWLQ